MDLYIGVLAAGLLVVANGRAEDLKSYVSKLNPKVAEAYKKRDSLFFDQLLDKDFRSRDEHGVLHNRKESLFVIRFQLNTLQVTNYQSSVESIKFEKAKGTVVTRSKMLALSVPRPGRPREKVEISRKWSDLYEKKGDSWQLVYRQELQAPIVKSTPMKLLQPASQP
jgi:hypothetical protein